MAKSRVLVVDGSSVSRELVTRILGDVIEHARVTGCASGAEALARLQTDRFDLITTSLLLSDMDGLDLCRRIRKSETHHYTPIIVISGDADERLLMEGFAAGVTDYFDKSLGYKAFGKFIRAFSQRNTGLVGKVLFVEDSLTAAAITRKMLERHGLQTTHTTTAEEAFQLLQRSRSDGTNDFDIVITDFYLKGEMTGGDLLHALRTRLHYSQQELPLLVITGNDDTKTQVRVFHAGANDFVNKPLVEEILMARVRSLLLIKHQYEALQRQARAMERVASTDALTGTRNRRYLQEQGHLWLKDVQRAPIWAMIIDIDHFKQINDTRGHLVGDHVLAAIGQQLNEAFADGIVVRFGGEEFAVLLPRADAAQVQVRAEAFRARVAALQPDGVPVTVSVGMANAGEHPMASLNRLIGLADQALYAAKAGGRNRVCMTAADGAQRPVGATA